MFGKFEKRNLVLSNTTTEIKPARASLTVIAQVSQPDMRSNNGGRSGIMN